MSNKPYLSVVIPCYNEEKNLKRGVLDQVGNYLKKQNYSSEVIISDDGATDGSRELVKKFCHKNPLFKQVLNEHGGKPFAIRSGLNVAKGEIILITDVDQSTPINQVAKLLPYFSEGYDVVIGSRGRAREGFSILRRVGSTVFRILRQQLLLKKIIDTQCGFKAFRNQVGKDLFSRLLLFKRPKEAKGWTVGAWDVELLFVAQKRGYRVAEAAVDWKDRDQSATKGNLRRRFFKESKEMFLEILRVKLDDLKGRYD